jgi:hypothetical protein
MDCPARPFRFALALLSAVLLAACTAEPPATSSGGHGGHVPPLASRVSSAGYTGDLPPLPKVQFAAARPAPLLRAAYEFAARHPEVLRHVPCFCGCERNGHGNNQDCFVARREADGRPEWNPHGIGCGICVDLALQAKQMHGAGSSLADIRQAIDVKYRAEYPTSTPTPLPH